MSASSAARPAADRAGVRAGEDDPERGWGAVLKHSQVSRKRRLRAALGAEALESRELLTGGGGDTFATITGEIARAGQTAAIKFTIDNSHFTLPRHALSLGIDISPVSGDGLKPLISSVDDSQGEIVPQTFHSVYDPHLPNTAVAGGKATSAVLTPLQLRPKHPDQSATYTVNVKGAQGTTGKFLLSFYLPGDANGSGTVNKQSVAAVRAAYGTHRGDADYNANADANRDGRIGLIDLAYAHQNYGVSTNIVPVASAILDSSSQAAAGTRNLAGASAKFTGTATPGAVILFTEASGLTKSVTTSVNSLGQYREKVPVAAETSTFEISARDAFGQTISGTLKPVIYSAGKPTGPGNTLNSFTSSTSFAIKKA